MAHFLLLQQARSLKLAARLQQCTTATLHCRQTPAQPAAAWPSSAAVLDAPTLVPTTRVQHRQRRHPPVDHSSISVASSMMFSSAGSMRGFAAEPGSSSSTGKSGRPAAAPSSTATAADSPGDAAAAAAAAPAAPTGAVASAAVIAKKLRLPPAVVSGAGAAAAGASKLSAAAARQVSRLVKLIQQTSLSQAAALQLSSVWQAHSSAITAAAAAAAVAGVYKFIAHPAAALVWDVSQPGPALGCLVASAAAVGAVGGWGRSRLVLDPERVYQVAMRKLTHHAGLQEVMGTPLAGSAMRVQLVTRGSAFLDDSLVPRLRAPRITMLFPLSGPLRSGVVSLQAKRAPSGKYAFKQLVVELPQQRLAGAAGMQAAAAAAAAASATQTPQPSGSAGGAGQPGSSGSSGSSADAARIYIVGSPRAAPSSSDSSSSSTASALAGGTGPQATRPPSAQALLEQLQQPLVFAMQQAVVIYETEDELEAELGYSSVLDPEQRSLMDLAKQGACVAATWSRTAGCKGLQQLRRAAVAVAQRSRSAMKKSSSSSSGASTGTSAGSCSSVATATSSQPAAPGGAEKVQNTN